MNRKTIAGIHALVLFAACFSCKTTNDNDSISSQQKPDTTWAITAFTKVDSVNPVLLPGDNTFTCPILKKEIRWEDKDVFNPAAVVKDGKVFLLYRAEDRIGKYAGTSRLGLAVSDDGLHFSKRKEPVFFPDNDSLKVYEWEGGVEDPRVVEREDGTYVLTYTAYDGNVARLLVASSPDLIKWKKHGLVLKGKYKDTWSKSGAIVARQEGSRIIATKVNGKYWMYFGDTDLFLASSDDLISWMPVEENNSLKSVLKPRSGKFDSRLVESGPYALMRDQGILLIYNSMNLDSAGRDERISPGTYCAGQALFNKDNPSELIDRLENSFMCPDKPYELEGQVNRVCFLEGLVPFNNRWFLYYGTADSKIAVAVAAMQ
jgi:beta-1,2-mannosidase